MIAAVCMLLALLAVLARCVWLAVRDWHRDAKLADHIAYIGACQLTGTVERLSMADLRERR